MQASKLARVRPPARLSLLLAIVGLAFAATGNLTILTAALLYMLGYVIVIANSTRLVRFGEEFSEQEQARLRLEASRAIKPTRAITRQATVTAGT